MEINIENYLSNEEIKDICKDVIKKHLIDVIGNVSVSHERASIVISKLAKELAKEGVQEIIPNFKTLINEQIESQIKNVKLSDFFVHSFGWQSQGNKILNSVLSDNKPLLDAKIKELFKCVDNEANRKTENSN